MKPYNQIQIGDIYQRTRQGVSWVVVGKDDADRLIQLRCSYQHPALAETIWKKPSDSIFTRRIHPIDSL